MKEPHPENREQQSHMLPLKLMELVGFLARMAAERDFALLAKNGSGADQDERRN